MKPNAVTGVTLMLMTVSLLSAVGWMGFAGTPPPLASGDVVAMPAGDAPAGNAPAASPAAPEPLPPLDPTPPQSPQAAPPASPPASPLAAPPQAIALAAPPQAAPPAAPPQADLLDSPQRDDAPAPPPRKDDDPAPPSLPEFADRLCDRAHSPIIAKACDWALTPTFPPKEEPPPTELFRSVSTDADPGGQPATSPTPAVDAFVERSPTLSDQSS